ncbi:hypothetical protein TUM4261_20150 [Shewanella sp. c952]|nr:hypothetical protein TUM4261_20150 [Shewanella sp. c952]
MPQKRTPSSKADICDPIQFNLRSGKQEPIKQYFGDIDRQSENNAKYSITKFPKSLC